MKRLSQQIRTWSACFDLMTDAFYIDEDREREGKQQKNNVVIAEISEAVLVLSAVAIVWVPILILLWP